MLVGVLGQDLGFVYAHVGLLEDRVEQDVPDAPHRDRNGTTKVGRDKRLRLTVVLWLQPVIVAQPGGRWLSVGDS